jgi:hypothetical protein
MSIEQKIAEMLAESKAANAQTSDETLEEGNVATANASAQEPSNIAAMAKSDGVTSVAGDNEENAKNATQKQDAAQVAKKSNNVANAKATAPEASHIAGVKEDIDALMNGEELSEEFKAKATTIFEAAVMTRVKAETARLEESYAEQLAEEVESVKEGLVEKVDGYLGYIVEQWVQENELALESGMKSEIMESFIEGMKSLFAEHYIEVPEEKFDVLGDLQESVQTLEEKLNEQVEKNVELTKAINEAKRSDAITTTATGLTDTDSEKFKALAEELSYEDSDTFATKLQTIRENYFGGKKVISDVKSVVTDTPVETLNEVAPMVDPSVKKYLSALDKLK